MFTATHVLSWQRTPLPYELAVEVVERKGVGHPDMLADGIAELASIRYSQHCLNTVGAVLHHNLDKVAVLGGRAAFTDTDGVYDRPLRIIFAGRISTSFAGESLPVREILHQAAIDHLRAVLPGIDRVRLEVRHETTDSSKFPHWFAPRSLDDLPERPWAFSNDTAYLVGSWPRTAAETVVLLAEAWFRRCAWAGSDIKALAVRDGGTFTVTVCVPALAGHLTSAAQFDDAVTAAAGELTEVLGQRLPGTMRVVCNTRGGRTGPLSGQYFTLSGSAVDYGEDGLVGRGNARTGVISGAHLAGNEATFGKNPAAPSPAATRGHSPLTPRGAGPQSRKWAVQLWAAPCPAGRKHREPHLRQLAVHWVATAVSSVICSATHRGGSSTPPGRSNVRASPPGVLARHTPPPMSKIVDTARPSASVRNHSPW